MRIQLDTGAEAQSIELTTAAKRGLKAFALEVMSAMQKEHPEFADCWVLCEIRFKEGSLQPVFTWGTLEDRQLGAAMTVLLPI